MKLWVLNRLALEHVHLQLNQINSNVNIFTIDLTLQLRRNYMHHTHILHIFMYKIAYLATSVKRILTS
jgi:hypothetical protein